MSSGTKFISDVKKLRQRARRHLSEGAVTQNYQGKVADAIERVLRNHPDGLVSSEQWVGPLTVRDEEVNQRRSGSRG